jgi:hypothetical protein
MGARIYIRILQESSIGPYPEPNESGPFFFKLYFNIILPYVLNIPRGLFSCRLSRKP